jgi:hypothetical protein
LGSSSSKHEAGAQNGEHILNDEGAEKGQGFRKGGGERAEENKGQGDSKNGKDQEE